MCGGGRARRGRGGGGMGRWGRRVVRSLRLVGNRCLKRPRGDYERLRGWIVETEKSDALSGRVMEFLWHVVFGKEAV